jgi:hypothetical protein
MDLSLFSLRVVGKTRADAPHHTTTAQMKRAIRYSTISQHHLEIQRYYLVEPKATPKSEQPRPQQGESDLDSG